MSQPIVEARGLSKSYRLWPEPSDRLTAGLLARGGDLPLLPGSWRRGLQAAAERRGRTFTALADVSFSLNRGESLGIIGRNGSGKSTLLQILAGTLRPTAGEVRVHGRVAALLELGSGFNPEFSGRDNVMLQASLYGLSRREAAARLPEVEEFAGIGAFIEQPVKIYSSGMMVRLAFATQTVLRPELFIVDEALSVGDVFFQARCARFFRDQLAEGMSIILVSHDLPSIKAFCQRTIVLHEGRVSFFGPSDAAISHYHQLHRGPIASAAPAADGEANPDPTNCAVRLPAGARERNWENTHEVGSREAEIVHCRLVNGAGAESPLFRRDEEIRLEVYARSPGGVADVAACVEISNRHNQVVHGVTSFHLDVPPQQMEAGRLYRFVFRFKARLGAGDYLVDAALGWGDRGDGAPAQLVHRVARLAAFKIHHDGPRPGFFGWVDLDARMHWE